jgi:hypothetical protein
MLQVFDFKRTCRLFLIRNILSIQSEVQAAHEALVEERDINSLSLEINVKYLGLGPDQGGPPYPALMPNELKLG